MPDMAETKSRLQEAGHHNLIVIGATRCATEFFLFITGCASVCAPDVRRFSAPSLYISCFPNWGLGSGALEEFAPEKEAHLTTCSFAAPEIPNQRLSMLLARAPPFGCFFRRALCVSRRQLLSFVSCHSGAK
jgi:hypothetical protein